MESEFKKYESPCSEVIMMVSEGASCFASSDGTGTGDHWPDFED